MEITEHQLIEPEQLLDKLKQEASSPTFTWEIKKAHDDGLFPSNEAMMMAWNTIHDWMLCRMLYLKPHKKWVIKMTLNGEDKFPEKI